MLSFQAQIGSPPIGALRIAYKFYEMIDVAKIVTHEKVNPAYRNQRKILIQYNKDNPEKVSICKRTIQKAFLFVFL